MSLDARSEANIATLLPGAQAKARALIELLALNKISAKIISGSRTYAQQDELYAHGRTKGGPKVTNAHGGYSWHNFGVAFDIGIFDGPRYLDESPLYAKAGALGKTLGLEWGGDWKGFEDEPHFQFNPHRLSLAQARDRVASGSTALA